MTEKKLDPTSDTARSDPKAAEENRKELSDKAGEKMHKAVTSPKKEESQK